MSSRAARRSVPGRFRKAPPSRWSSTASVRWPIATRAPRRDLNMRIAVVGAGAIGGYLGTKLAAAGEDVTFIARGANLAAIQKDGMKLILEDGSEVHARPRAYQKPQD